MNSIKEQVWIHFSRLEITCNCRIVFDDSRCSNIHRAALVLAPAATFYLMAGSEHLFSAFGSFAHSKPGVKRFRCLEVF